MLRLRKSYSQIGQDERVARRYGSKPGFFVEVGASDGIRLSNTYALEQELGWRGICVEPVPSAFEALCRNRPGAICSSRPLLDRKDVEVEFNIWDYTLLSGIVDFITARPETKDGRRVKMETETLTDVLDRSGAPAFIEYLSLDTEGSELAILKGVDWSRYRFGMIHVEHNYIEPARAQICEFLTQQGYKRAAENKWDDEYVDVTNA
jgi:FkbM family methyltransferase